VDFELSPDEADLKEGIRKLCEGRFPMERVRALEETGGVQRTLWSELAETGVFSLRLPEDQGGLALGMAQSVLVFEELGRALVPGPLVGTDLAAQVLPWVASGEEVVGVVERSSDPLLVDYLDAIDRLLVLDDEGVWSVPPDEVEDRGPVTRPIDPLTPLHLVSTMPQGEQVGDASTAARLRLDGTVLTAALLVGSAQAVTELAVEYAKERVQFGRPIGGFQAVKHILADMQTRASVAQAALYAAGVMVDDPEVGDPARAASAAKITAGEAAILNGKGAIQVHGGMGFTWEVDAHLHLKRAWFLETTFGSVDHHSEVLAHLL
jgi:alkylation response protein AidB-like acyl-CoA dehydrogenase